MLLWYWLYSAWATLTNVEADQAEIVYDEMLPVRVQRQDVLAQTERHAQRLAKKLEVDG